jgi:hypothetical protein
MIQLCLRTATKVVMCVINEGQMVNTVNLLNTLYTVDYRDKQQRQMTV